jgi:phenylacetyl-CoA:acceptor oxidoreductase subunit 1
MTRWVIVADLNRCVGCQTCTSACKHANATAPGIQWRKVLDFEVGEYPDVHRAFMPVGCMHCDEPPCFDVCPSTATGKRPDGIVTIDYDLCIGCAYCSVACPYQARARVDIPNMAYGKKSMRHEVVSEHWDRRGVAQKCTFCIDRVDPGLEAGLTPGIDERATPACVNSCIAGALHFGDLDDPDSNVSKLVAENAHFRMHEDLNTGPGILYLWDRGTNEKVEPPGPPPMVADPVGMAGVSARHQSNWDWRAAANFIGGGSGTGLFLATAIASLFGAPIWPAGLLALVLVATGLFYVWMEIGRFERFINVFFHPGKSWMSREAIAAMPFFLFGVLALFSHWSAIWLVAAASGMVFLFCQGQILHAAKGIPAWREKAIVPLIIATGLTEGIALFAIFAVLSGADMSWLQTISVALVLLTAVRFGLWHSYRQTLGKKGAPVGTFTAFDRGFVNLRKGPQLFIAIVAILGFWQPILLVVAGFAATLTGWGFKYTLINRAAFNQGYEITRMPARGAGVSAVGIKPGWKTT